MRTLHVIVIHAKHLTYRKKNLLATLNLIEGVCAKVSYTYVCDYIHEHERQDAQNAVKEYEEQIEKYTGDDKTFVSDSFTIEQISNYLKQRSALEKIVELDSKKDDIYMIIEDDCTIIPEYVSNLTAFLSKPDITEWDIIFLGIPSSTTEYKFIDTREKMKIIPSKDIYCINPKTAKTVLSHLQKLMFPYRKQLSYIIHTNTDIRSMYSSKRVSIEGSKFGVYPSSVIENNVLIYNTEFMELYNTLVSNKVIDIKVIEQHYKSAEYLYSPDIMHIYGVLLYKCNNFTMAQQFFEKALECMQMKNGLITRRSELLNNAISINSKTQTV